jgi:hypothetical protein
MLHVVGSPYVVRLYEKIRSDNNIPLPDRQFIAMTTGIYGQMKEVPFRLSQAIKPARHPFASFRLEKPVARNLYIWGGKIEDQEIKKKLTKEI